MVINKFELFLFIFTTVAMRNTVETYFIENTLWTIPDLYIISAGGIWKLFCHYSANTSGN